MKRLLILIILFTTLSTCSKNKKEHDVSTYYFIRHAEKDRSDKTNKNPHLTRIGKTRAVNWSKILEQINFDAVYTTDYYRTKETAQPTAEKNSLELTIYNPNTIDEKEFLNTNKGKTVLIVGHSNTTPKFVNAIIGNSKYNDINDSNNGNLYIVTLANKNITDQVLTIN